MGSTWPLASPDSPAGHKVGGLTYFVPDKADAVGVFDAATRLYTQVDAGQQLQLLDVRFGAISVLNSSKSTWHVIGMHGSLPSECTAPCFQSCHDGLGYW